MAPSLVQDVLRDLQAVQQSLFGITRRLVDLEGQVVEAQSDPPQPVRDGPPESSGDELLTFKQFVERHPEWTVRRLQHLRFHESRFGLESCFVKLGRRVLVKEGELLRRVTGDA